MTHHVRHGDVLLLRTGDVPADHSDREPLTAIVARGEATGHAHRVRGNGIALRGDRLLVPEETEITHEEHRALVLVPGEYRVIHQVEITAVGLRRRVLD